jgi:hypothetical protein
VVQQRHAEQGVDAEDPLSRALWYTQLDMAGFLTARDKTPGTKGTRHPNPETPLPGMPGRGISGLG